MNPLKSITGTIIIGVVISVIVMILFSDGASSSLQWVVWFHAMAGIAWVGLLYYFNFVQVPAVAKALSEVDAGGPGAASINKYVAPRALLWFRWASVATWFTGAYALAKLGLLGSAFRLEEGAAVIGVGAWLGTIMLINVWVFIWPNQKKFSD